MDFRKNGICPHCGRKKLVGQLQCTAVIPVDLSTGKIVKIDGSGFRHVVTKTYLQEILDKAMFEEPEVYFCYCIRCGWYSPLFDVTDADLWG